MNLSKQEFLSTNSAKYIQDKRKLRAELDVEMAKYLKRGGEIKGVEKQVEKTTNKQKTMRSIMSASVAQAQANRSNPSTIARNEARQKNLKHYHGSVCSACGSTMRYTSTASCFYCNKASAARRSKANIKKGATV